MPKPMRKYDKDAILKAELQHLREVKALAIETLEYLLGGKGPDWSVDTARAKARAALALAKARGA